MGDRLYNIECSCISKFVLIQHILGTQVSDTGPMVLWLLTGQQYLLYLCSSFNTTSKIYRLSNFLHHFDALKSKNCIIILSIFFCKTILIKTLRIEDLANFASLDVLTQERNVLSSNIRNND